MTISPDQLLFLGSTNMPEADALTVGGAVNGNTFIVFSDISPGATLDAVSDNAGDTAVKISFAGRDSTGVIRTVVGGTLNGTTPVVGLGSAINLERLLYAVITGGSIGPLSDPGGSSPAGKIALYGHTPVISAHTAQAGSVAASGVTPPLFKMQAGDGSAVSIGQIVRITSGTGVNQLVRILATSGYGTDFVAVTPWSGGSGIIPDGTSVYSVYNGMLFQLGRNSVTRLFATSASDVVGGSTRTYYEKVFAVNINTTPTTLVGAQVEIVSESPSLPSGQTMDIALTTALNDTGTVANRQTVPPSGITSFTVQPALVNVPSPGNLPGGAFPNAAGAQGIWIRLTMLPGSGSFEGQVLLRLEGNTT